MVFHLNEKNAKEIVERARKEGVEIVKFEWMGLDLILRNMSTSVEYLEDAIKYGIGVTKAQQSFNVLDHLVHDGLYGSQSSEFKLVPDTDTYASLPHVKGLARMQTELSEPEDLRPTESDPRYFLRRMLSSLDEMGIEAKCAMEAEFYLFNASDGTPFINGKLMDSQGIDRSADFIQEVRKTLGAMGIKVEHLKKEYGGSQFEITYRYGDPLLIADQFIVLKNVIKALASQRSLVASFMPKVSTESPGSGLHIHLSLYDSKTSKNMLHDEKDTRGTGLSSKGYSFLGGLMKHMKALCAFENPLSNSYKRLIPGSWAPAHVSYGYDHRGVAIRIPSNPPGDTESKRYELRLPDCSANPHIAIGAIIAAGIDGLEHNIDPGEPIDYDPADYTEAELKKKGVEMLPTTLVEAIHYAEDDRVLREYMGKLLFDEYIKVRKSEWDDYYKNVDQWEVNNFRDSI